VVPGGAGPVMNPLLDTSARPVIGHRGAAAYAPENTLASFRLALALGAEALEFDIRRSADGEAVVFHDSTLDRTTDRAGPVGALSRAELARVDAGHHFSEDGGASHPFRASGIGVPSLGEVIAAFPAVPLLIEIKEPEVQHTVARVLEDTGAADRAVVAGADWRALAAFNQAPFHRGASRRDIARAYFRLGRADTACRCYAVPERYYGLPVPTRRFVNAAHRRSITVHVWTVDDARSALNLWRKGVNGIVSNRPDVILAARSIAPAPDA
jgi:glycerophosphoryl diester phosphodiesterase